MSNFTFGLCVPNKFSSSLESYCENNNIQFQYWSGISEPSVSGMVEYLFKSEKDCEKAAAWVERLKKLN